MNEPTSANVHKDGPIWLPRGPLGGNKNKDAIIKSLNAVCYEEHRPRAAVRSVCEQKGGELQPLKDERLSRGWIGSGPARWCVPDNQPGQLRGWTEPATVHAELSPKGLKIS